MAEKLTITLTGRPPVKIDRDEWPVLASARADVDDDRSGTGTQANRETLWRVTVRAHSDGRKIVYAVYKHTSAFRGENGAHIRGGKMIAADDDIVKAIQNVCADVADRVGGGDGSKFRALAHECIADLPAEEV